MSWPVGIKPQRVEAFACYALAARDAIVAAALADRERGHEPIPAIFEFVDETNALSYEVLDSPRCNHLCPQCRADIDEAAGEFGRGSIGMFDDSSRGEMERLRRELSNLASTINKALPQVQQVVAALQATQAPAARELEDGQTGKKKKR